MDPTAPADEPAPELPLEDTAEPASVAEEVVIDPPTGEGSSPDAGPDGDELTDLAAQAQTRRLSPVEEERAAALLKDRLRGGKGDVAAAAEVLPKLAWMVGVTAVADVWQEMKATAKTQLLKALAEDASDGARRVRLSLARALFKLEDQPTALKVAVSVTKEMRSKESGEVSPRDAQIFSSVFLGKAKPWCAQLPLAELRPSDADTLVHCAIIAAFATVHPPVTQLGVLKWAAENGRLAKLQESASSLVIKSVGRWGAKWQAALRNEVAELPEELLAALPVPSPRGNENPTGSEDPGAGRGETAEETDPERPPDAEDGPPSDADGDAQRRERPVYVSKTIPSRDAPEGQERRGRENRGAPRPASPEGSAPGAARGPAARNQQFNIGDVLRQIDAHVSWLRSELKSAENKLRARDDEPRRGRRRLETVVIEGEPSIEELARLNLQLESRISVLQAQITELTADSEDRAASRGALGDAPAPGPDEQLRTLLALKLQDDYADFLALEQEARDLVVQQHYRSLLREVFNVLKNEGVPLRAPSEASG